MVHIVTILSWQFWSCGHRWSFRKSLPATIQRRTLWLGPTVDWTAEGRWGVWNQSNADEGLNGILPFTDMAAEKLCDIDPEWEHSSTVRRGIRAMLHPYYEILQKKIKTVDGTFSWCLLNHGLRLLQENKKWFNWYFFNYLCNFLYTQFIKLKLYVMM